MSDAKNPFYLLLKHPPHKDISAINTFIITGCFTRQTNEVLEFIRRTGYDSDMTSTLHYINFVKKQLKQAVDKFGESIEIDFFCDVAGTKYFDDFMLSYDNGEFYKDMTAFSPDLNFTGDAAKIKRRAFLAVMSKRLSCEHPGISYFNDALEEALKKIGVNPQDEINGVSKSVLATMHLMDSIGGIQIYLPKAHPLKCAINDIGIYADSFKMDLKSIALKHGVTNKTVSAVIHRVRKAIKEYEGINEDRQSNI